MESRAQHMKPPVHAMRGRAHHLLMYAVRKARVNAAARQHMAGMRKRRAALSSANLAVLTASSETNSSSVTPKSSARCFRVSMDGKPLSFSHLDTAVRVT